LCGVIVAERPESDRQGVDADGCGQAVSGAGERQTAQRQVLAQDPLHRRPDAHLVHVCAQRRQW